MDKNAKNETRGGARPGSGRKASNKKKVTISFRVTEETRDKIQELRESGVNVNQYLETMIRMLTAPKGRYEIRCGGSRSGKSFQTMLAAMTEAEMKEETIIIDEDLTKPAWPTIKTVKISRDD